MEPPINRDVLRISAEGKHGRKEKEVFIYSVYPCLPVVKRIRRKDAFLCCAISLLHF